jgi:hypothetical protein
MEEKKDDLSEAVGKGVLKAVAVILAVLFLLWCVAGAGSRAAKADRSACEMTALTADDLENC